MVEVLARLFFRDLRKGRATIVESSGDGLQPKTIGLDGIAA
jgi:hypothetical protein